MRQKKKRDNDETMTEIVLKAPSRVLLGGDGFPKSLDDLFKSPGPGRKGTVRVHCKQSRTRAAFPHNTEKLKTEILKFYVEREERLFAQGKHGLNKDKKSKRKEIQ